MSDDEVFYDSLDEDIYENEGSPSNFSPIEGGEGVELRNGTKKQPIEDLADVVPLYSGEISKDKVPKPKKKKIEKPRKSPILSNSSKNKSYLAMYYEKRKRFEGKLNTKGSTTSRAECGKLSPGRDSHLEDDLKGIESVCHSETDSEQEEFYENFMSLELENQKTSSVTSLTGEKKTRISKFSSPSSVNLQPSANRPFCLNYCTGDATNKMEQFKKRQSYGIKMSMKNRIRMQELKTLKEIKNSKRGQ